MRVGVFAEIGDVGGNQAGIVRGVAEAPSAEE
jgi:hypothetical protein